MKKILVTGASGFIGDYVIKELLRQGHDIIATSVSDKEAQDREWFNKVHYIPFDLRDTDRETNLYDFFDKPDLLIHLAWEGLPNYKSAFHVDDNLPRHQLFLQNLFNHGLKDISITGTCFEYGLQEGCLSEKMPTLPANSYAMAKNKLRIVTTEMAEKKEVSLKWIRLFYMYGTGQGTNSLFSQLQAALDRGDKVFNMSPGDQLRDYLPVEKVAEYIIAIASQSKVTGIINCCSGVPITVKSLVEKYLQVRNASISLNLGYYPYNDIEPRNFWGDPSKLKKIIEK